MCIMFLIYTCTLLKVVSRYDLSVLSMDVSDGFQKSWNRCWVGGVYLLFWDFWNLFNFAKPANN